MRIWPVQLLLVAIRRLHVLLRYMYTDQSSFVYKCPLLQNNPCYDSSTLGSSWILESGERDSWYLHRMRYHSPLLQALNMSYILKISMIRKVEIIEGGFSITSTQEHYFPKGGV